MNGNLKQKIGERNELDKVTQVHSYGIRCSFGTTGFVLGVVYVVHDLNRYEAGCALVAALILIITASLYCDDKYE